MMIVGKQKGVQYTMVSPQEYSAYSYYQLVDSFVRPLEKESGRNFAPSQNKSGTQ